MVETYDITVLAKYPTHRRRWVLWRWICEECGELHESRTSTASPYPDSLTCPHCGALWKHVHGSIELRRGTALYGRNGYSRVGLLLAAV